MKTVTTTETPEGSNFLEWQVDWSQYIEPAPAPVWEDIHWETEQET